MYTVVYPETDEIQYTVYSTRLRKSNYVEHTHSHYTVQFDRCDTEVTTLLLASKSVKTLDNLDKISRYQSLSVVRQMTPV